MSSLVPPTLSTTVLLLRPREAAQALAISPRKLFDLTVKGKVRCVRIGRAVRYRIADLETALTAMST